jgi:iron(III) transport system permease protein
VGGARRLAPGLSLVRGGSRPGGGARAARLRQQWLGVERLPAIATGYSGALLALAFFTYPYIYLPLVAVLRDLDPALEEGARSLGASRWGAFWRVVLPQLRPPILAGSLLVALYALSDLGAVEIVRYNTFTLAIFNAYRGLFDRSVAASLATVLVAMTFLLIVAEALASRRLRPYRLRPARPAERVRLGRWRWPSLLFLGLLASFTLALPIGVLIFWGARGLATGNALGEVGAAVGNTLGVSALAALAATLLALPIALWSVRHPGKVARLVERSTWAGHALPGLIVALSLVFLAARHVPLLYQSVPLLAIAYVIRFLPQATSASRSSLAAVSPAWEEAARSLGQTPFQVLRKVTLPLILPGILAGGGLVFLTSMKELPATILLRPIGFETLATEIWTAASEAIWSAAALPALALVAVTAPPLYWLVIRPVLRERP